MALIKCEKCGELISGKAKRCPNCERKEKRAVENKQFAGAVITMIVITIIVAICTICN